MWRRRYDAPPLVLNQAVPVDYHHQFPSLLRFLDASSKERDSDCVEGRRAALQQQFVEVVEMLRIVGR